MNVVALIGRLTANPELKYSQDGKAVANYCLAVERPRTDADCDFINCVAFGAGAEFVNKYFRKGSKIAVTGHISTGSYKKKDGTVIHTFSVIAEQQDFCERKSDNSNYEPPEASQSTTPKNTQESTTAPSVNTHGFTELNDDDSELPF